MIGMEWDEREAQQENQNQNQTQRGDNNGGGGGVMYVKVMTDEQLETLRKQIAVYATICEQLVEMHKSLSAHQDLAAGCGGRLGFGNNIYSDPLMMTSGGLGGHKISGRQRWTPTPVQLQILESIFEQGNGTPSKQKIKDITMDLTQHGQISETNVYNWFQNRRARSKRKHLVSSSAINNNNTNNPAAAADSEADTEVDSLLIMHHHETKTSTNPDHISVSNPNPTPRRDDDDNDDDDDDEHLCFHRADETMSSSQLHFLGVFSNPRDDDHLTGKMGMPAGTGSYNHHHLYNDHDHADDYNMAGN